MNSFTTISDIPTMNSPEEFVQELIKMKANVRIYDFMLELKARFYPKVNMILYEDFSQYVGRDHEFCIDARMYYKYSKLLVPGYEFDLKTCDKKSDIRDVLKSSNMENDINYRLRIESEPVVQGGFVKSNRYMMNPESFYLLLMNIFLIIATLAMESPFLKLINNINKYIHGDNSNEFYQLFDPKEWN